MKPVKRGAFDTRARDPARRPKACRAEDLFLPSVVEIVRHLARIAAERDYAHFLATGEIRYAAEEMEESDD